MLEKIAKGSKNLKFLYKISFFEEPKKVASQQRFTDIGAGQPSKLPNSRRKCFPISWPFQAAGECTRRRLVGGWVNLTPFKITPQELNQIGCFVSN
jgi:hypothetical protein